MEGKKKLHTLVFLLDPLGRRVLLGMKKRGRGAGRWNGFGGKVEDGEEVIRAAVRELREECGAVVDVGDLRRVGVSVFEHAGDPVVTEDHVFIAEKFTGEIVESEEMSPRWFGLDPDGLPFSQMWPGDRRWIPTMIQNWQKSKEEEGEGEGVSAKVFHAHFRCGGAGEILEERIDVLPDEEATSLTSSSSSLFPLENLHRRLRPPSEKDVVACEGVVGQGAEYWHYGCDGDDDRGWGCGYRTLQTLCSWISRAKGAKAARVPSLEEIQRILVRAGDKEAAFAGSRNWIGSVEVSLVLDVLFDVPCRIVHVRRGGNLVSKEGEEEEGHSSPSPFDRLEGHFREFGSPVMMGGDADAASKAVFGTCRGAAAAEEEEEEERERHLLIVDPHLWRGRNRTVSSLDEIAREGFLAWKRVPEDFCQSSFYNLCFPLVKQAT